MKRNQSWTHSFRIVSRCILLFTVCIILPAGSPAADKKTDENKQTVFITGANRGLGLEFSKQFAARGYTVISTARTPEEATELKATGAQIIKLDVTSDEHIAAMTKTLEGRTIDLLINNAGYKSTEMTREAMMYTFSVNAVGPAVVAEALLPNLKRSENPKIVNISSKAGTLNGGNGKGGAYSVSKTALNMVTRNLHSRLSKEGFVVISLVPGRNKTDMGGKETAPLHPKDSIARMIPLIEELTPDQSGRFWYLDGSELPW